MPSRSEPDAAALAACPPHLHEPLLRCARGELPTPVALMHIAMAAKSAAQVAESLFAAHASLRDGGAAEAARRIGHALDLWHEMPEAFSTVSGILDAVDHERASMPATEAIRHWAAAYDRAATVSPEASVALYSFGDPDLLDAMTDEVAARMAEWDLLGPNRTLLDIGCGIGRFAQRLAPQARFIAALDISPRMLAVARRRCADLGNVAFVRSSGRDLAAFADARFDILYAIDIFPYLAESGTLAAAHFQDAARVLKPGGRFLLINYSYAGGIESQRAEVAHLAAQSGFAVLRDGIRAFRLWDGWTFLMQRS
jgi:SAM-dependent methyltransferase